eukprot:11037551-Lingulodinium_polyedra.AAC.1
MGRNPPHVDSARDDVGSQLVPEVSVLPLGRAGAFPEADDTVRHVLAVRQEQQCASHRGDGG